MSTVKSLLLGTAAALTAVAGVQAADMPVKAKPVEYVKICTGYGDGFYYIPGTDTCLKLGGFLRVQVAYNAGGEGIPIGNSGVQAPQARFARDVTNDINFRTRAVVSWDVRQKTEYGDLRTYIRIGIQQTTPVDTEGGVVYWDRAFLQFAGFTVGKTLSFYDIFTYSGVYSYHDPRPVGDTTISNGVTVWAYTAQFGNGFSGTLSLEDPGGHNRTVVIDNTVPAFFGLNGTIAGDSAFHAQAAGQRLPRAGHRRQPAGRSALGLRRRERGRPRSGRRLLAHAQQRRQRPSQRQARLGAHRRRQVQPAGRRYDRLQRLLHRGRLRLLHPSVVCAAL